MDNQAILEKAISQAIDGGFDLTLVGGFYTKGQMKTKDFKWGVSRLDKGLATIWSYDLCISCDWTYYEDKQISSNVTKSSYRHMNFTTEQIIFNHDFAKALWGNRETKDHFGGQVEFYDFGGEDWQYHLMCMVIAENPIEYLGANI